MSIRAIVWAFDQKVHNTSAKLVLLKLADNANDEGKCWPSLYHLAEHCEMNREQISKYCKMLSELGFIKIIHRTKEGVSLPNVYHLNLEGGVVSAATGCCPTDNTVLSHRQPESPSESPSESEESKPATPPPSGGTLSPKIKEAADKVYQVDRAKFKRLVVWIKQAQKYNFSEDAIILALDRFLPYAKDIDNWYPYLDKIIEKAVKDINARESLELHKQRLAEDKATARMLGLGEFGNA